MAAPHPGNDRIASRLEEVARLLEAQDGGPFRVRAYRYGARAIRDDPRDVAALAKAEGREGLEAIPGIGETLSRAILEIVETGRLAMLDRLRGEADPEALLSTVPGVGPVLAARIHDRLGVETLEELEAAAWDGRLSTVPGVGARRIEALRAVLDARLGRFRARLFLERTETGGPDGVPPRPDAPPVADLLSVDAEYRAGAREGTLRTIAPRRFNPHGVAWLPILHTRRGEWHVHALFSNTALAHRLKRTRDWVVLYYDRDGEHGQATVVTERRGPMEGLRVIRGREPECAAHYEAERAATPG